MKFATLAKRRLLSSLLPAALLLAACAANPVALTLPAIPPSAGGAVSETAPTRVPATVTLTPLLPSPAPALTATDPPPASATASSVPSATSPATAAPSDTPLPSETPLPATSPATEPAVTASPPPALDTAVPPTASPSPVPPDSTQSPGQFTYVIYSEQYLGEYVARIWVQADYPFPNFLSLGTIDRGTERLVQISDVAGFEPLPAADLTGDGQPDVAFALRWGGSHCCWGTVLYNLGATPQQVLWVGGEVGTGKFRDLDNDGDWEFITRDRVSGIPCSQPSPMAVLAYSPGQGYVPASPFYPAVFEPEIIDYTAQAEQRAQANGVMAPCDVSDLMLDYLYSGQSERGAAEFARLYTAPDAPDVWAALQAAARGGRLYVEPAP